jgi:hypothetical protein
MLPRVTRLVLLCAAMLALLISCSVTFSDGVKYTCTKDEDCGGDGYTCARSPARSVCCKATGAEVCDKLDNDCDGFVDNTGKQEICNGLDDDCNDRVDDGFDLKTNSNHCGECNNLCPGTQFCKNSTCTIRLESVCFDNFDDDGNGQTDCEDPSCENRSCGTSCLCTGFKRSEDRCDDNVDNDVGPDGGGDGLVDCADSDCVGKSCRAGCTCVLDGGRRESDCTDGLDNDLDTRIDCLDPDCVNQFCTPPDIYFRCTAAQTCRCNGGVQVSEVGSVLCRDGVDNDCDGEIDCDEASCLGQSCSPDGGAVGCECGGSGKKEVGCSNNRDDDGDLKVDCADTDCQGRSCRLPDAGEGMCSQTQCN